MQCALKILDSGINSVICRYTNQSIIYWYSTYLLAIFQILFNIKMRDFPNQTIAPKMTNVTNYVVMGFMAIFMSCEYEA